MKGSEPGIVLFREDQHMRDVVWVMVLVLGIAALNWTIFIEQVILGRPVGNNPGSDLMVVVVWILFGWLFPLFFLRLRLRVEVLPGLLRIDYGLLSRRAIPLGEVATVKPVTYYPIRQWGGWGLRGWGGRVAYNVRGNRGVELELVDGRTILIGSQRPEELALAITASRRE